MVMIMIKFIIIIAIIMIITPCPCRLYATPSSLFVTKIAFFSRFCWLTASALHVSSSISFTKQTYSPCSYLIHAVLKRHLSRYTRTADFHENSSPLQNIFFIHPNYKQFHQNAVSAPGISGRFVSRRHWLPCHIQQASISMYHSMFSWSFLGNQF